MSVCCCRHWVNHWTKFPAGGEKSQQVGCFITHWLRYRSFKEQASHIIISRIVFFLCIGRESTMWPANNCPQIMVCSYVVQFNRALLQMIFYSWVVGTTLSREKWQIASLSCQEVVVEWKNYYWTRLSHNIVICQCLADQLFASAFGFGK